MGYLNWSDSAYKMTIGIGCLGILNFEHSLFGGVLPIWFQIIWTCAPIFIMVVSGMMGIHSKASQVVASLIYLTTTAVLVPMATVLDQCPRGWQLFLAFLILGAIPCLLILKNSVDEFCFPIGEQ